MKRVLEGAPWTFDNNLLLLHRLVEGDVPPQIHVDFWVRIHELQVGYMSLGIGKQLGDFIGTSVDYDTIKNNGARRSYMRIRVTIDGHHPLKKIRKGEGSSYMVQFKYERIGHADRFCEHLFEMHERERLGDMVKGVGKEKLRRGWWSMAAGGYRICNCHVIPAS
jgi:14-3-3 protein epsilon